MILVAAIAAAPIAAGAAPKPSCSRRSRRGISVVKSFTPVNRVGAIGALGGAIGALGGSIGALGGAG